MMWALGLVVCVCGVAFVGLCRVVRAFAGAWVEHR